MTPCGGAYCNCGVAAIAGQDVFYIDYCDGAVGIDYKSCGDKILEVKSYTELKYEVRYCEERCEMLSTTFGVLGLRVL